MKRIVSKCISIFLLILIIVPIALAIQRYIVGGAKCKVEFSPYYINISCLNSTEGNITEAFVYHIDTQKKYSFLQYAHVNFTEGVCNDTYFSYCADSVQYKFNFNDFENPIISFEMGGKQYTFDKDKENIVIKSGKWPFEKSEIVCALPSEDSFYAPVKIAGIDGYGIVLAVHGLNSDKADNISVYLKSEAGWKHTNFILPNGTESEEILGYMRRHFQLNVDNFLDDSSIGNLELCIPEQDGTARLFHVEYVNGNLVLEGLKFYSDGVPADWKF